MRTIQLLFLLWVMASVIESQPSCSLVQNFWIVSTSGEFIECRPCPDCPEGHGLNIQCGSSITDDTKIECVQCKETETYSDSHGVESCKPCQDCGQRNVLQECTSDQNRKCGRKCPKGYFFDGHITDCRENTPATVSTTTLSIEPSPSIWPQLSSPMGGGSSTAITASMKVLFSLKSATSTSLASTPSTKPQRSSMISVFSAEIPGSIEVPLLVGNRSSTSRVESTLGIMPQPSSLYRGSISTSIPGSIEVLLPVGNVASPSVSAKQNTTQRRKGKTLSLVRYILGIITTIVLIVTFTRTVRVCWIKCRMSKKTKPEQTDPAGIPLNPLRFTENSPSRSLPETKINVSSFQSNSGSAESLMASQGTESLEDRHDGQGDGKDCVLTSDIPEDFKLADFPYDVVDFILQLDSDSSPVQKNWKHVAHEYGITKQDIQLLEIESRKPGVSAIRLLIGKLCSSKCATLKEFVDVLQELERNDVANDIMDWFKKKQERCSEEDKN